MHLDRRQRNVMNGPAALGTHRTHINLNLEHRNRPAQRYVTPYRSYGPTRSGLARRTYSQCTRAHTPERCSCEFSPRISAPVVLLNVLKISWTSCENFGVNSTDSNLECAYYEVPMDYHDSSAGTARLAVIKYAATASDKLGTIFFNPGNPPYPLSVASY